MRIGTWQLATAAMMFAAAASLRGASVTFFAREDLSGPSNRIFLRDGITLCPIGYDVQALYGTCATSAPTAVEGDGFVVGTPVCILDRTIAVGDDDGAYGGTFGAGEVSVNVGGAQAGDQTVFRVFNGSDITNAAFYGDSDVVLATFSSIDDHLCIQPIRLDKFNPAYAGLVFDMAPSREWNGTNFMVRGSVSTVDSNDNYRLSNTDVVLQWRTNLSSWNYLGAPSGSNGDFYVQPPVADLDIRARCATANLPASPPATIIPEPTSVLLAVMMAVAIRRRGWRWC